MKKLLALMAIGLLASCASTKEPTEADKAWQGIRHECEKP